MKRKASQDLPREGKEAPSLLTLPAELRELIYYFALVEPEPMVAYMNKRTIRRPADYNQSYTRLRSLVPVQQTNRPSTVREVKTHPQKPPLAFVSKQIRGEALAVFFRENIFVFNLDSSMGQLSCEVERWCDYTGIASFTKCWTVLLEFTIVAMVAADTRGSRPTTITISLDPGGKLLITYGGALADECTCWLSKQAAERNEWVSRHPSLAPDSIGLFANDVEDELEGQWKLSARRRDLSYRCVVCEKSCCAPENIMERDYR